MSAQKKQAAAAKTATSAVQPQPATQPAAVTPAPTPAAAVAAPTPAQPSKQTQMIEKLMEGWKLKGVDLSHLTITDDGTKYKVLIVAEGWPTVAVGSSGGVTVRELKSYQSAFEAALIGKELYDRQKARDQKRAAATVAPAPTPAPAPAAKETVTQKKSKQHEAVEQQLASA